MQDQADVREPDLLDALLLSQNPLLPTGVAVGHSPQDDFGHLESRVAEANCAIS